MIYQKINSIKNNFIFLSSKDTFEYEAIFHTIFKLSFNYKIIEKMDLDKEIYKQEIITLDPKIYEFLKSKVQISLFVFSTDDHFSHFYNLAKYIKANQIKNKDALIYNDKFFNNFLWNYFPFIEKKNFFLKLINKFKLNFYKFYITKKIWLPLIRHDENIFKGIKVGYSTNNCYMSFNHLLKKDYNEIINKISDESSKIVFKKTLFGKPYEVKKQYFKLLFDYDQYLHYLNFNETNIINLGVASGFEIPFFLTRNIKKLINVDPTKDKHLSPYVKLFCELFKDKLVFDERFLYSDNKTYEKNNTKPSNLKEIISHYNLNSNLIIKSDIEGLEMNMLDELESIIKKLRPQLAISIYHIDDKLFPIHSQLTLIPMKIINMAENYNFYIKHYTYNRRETIFYAIPKEKNNHSRIND